MRQMPIAGFGLLALSLVTGCATVSNLAVDTMGETSPEFQGAFIDSAVPRVKAHYKSLTPQGDGSLPRVSRAFSGEPSYLTEKSRRAIDESGGIVHAPAAQKYLQGILDRLLRNWPYETPRIGVFIASTPHFGGQATSEGDILIYSGSLLAFSSEDELAAMLAHEASHILLRHFERQAEVEATKKFANFAVSTAALVFLASNSQVKKTAPGQYEASLADPNRFAKQLAQTAAVCLATRYFIDKIVDPGWSRVQEDEADLLAADLMHRAGYDLSGHVQALQHQRDFDGTLADRLKTQQRAKDGEYGKVVDEHVRQQGLAGVFTGFTVAVTQGVVNTIEDLDTLLSQSHRLTEHRQKGLQSYIARQYITRERRALQSQAYAQIFKSGSMPQYLLNHQKAYEAFRLLNTNAERAEQLALESIRPPSDHAAATRFVMYLVHMSKDDRNSAYAQIRAIRNIEAAPATILLAAAQEHWDHGNQNEARRLARLGFAKVGLDPGNGQAPRHGRGLEASCAVDAEQEAARKKSLESFFGFDVKGPCDAVNTQAKNLFTQLGGGQVERDRCAGVVAKKS